MIKTHVIKFPKIRVRTKLKALAFSLILLTYLTAFIFQDIMFWSIAGITLVICGSWWDYLTYSREDPMPFLAEPIIFDEDNIVINGEVFAVNEVQNLKIVLNNYDGETMKGRGRWILNGTNNHLSFVHLKKRISIMFYVISEEQKKQFKTLFDRWYNNHVPFYEGNVSGKTYLLERLDYSEIQAFKRKYKIS